MADSFTPNALPAGQASSEPPHEVDLEKHSTMTAEDDASVHSDPKIERRFLWKLDLYVLTWAWLGTSSFLPSEGSRRGSALTPPPLPCR